MTNAEASLPPESAADPVQLEEAITLLETGQAEMTIRVDFGDGYFGVADGPYGLEGLLQRARGLRLIAMMARGEPVERPGGMRSGKPVLHPLVEEILDVVKTAD